MFEAWATKTICEKFLAWLHSILRFHNFFKVGRKFTSQIFTTVTLTNSSQLYSTNYNGIEFFG
jgi:hypothetical protein